VEKLDKVVEIEDIEDTFLKYFSIRVLKFEPKVAKAWVQSNYFVPVVKKTLRPNIEGHSFVS